MADLIDKLILNVTDKETATVLKNDMAKAGVPKKCLKIRNKKKTNTYTLTIENANDNLKNVIDMFVGSDYQMSLDDVQKMLNIQIVLE